jgi:cbb3-type cytochrome oxidase subunit 1
MTWFVRAFLKASLAWLALGVTVGVAMAAHPVWTVYRLAHVHMLLLGFVTMMIFGVAYHVIPRFVGFGLHRPALAGVHWWLANVGLALMVGGFVARVVEPATGTVVLAVGGVLSALGAYLFVYVLWRTLDGPVRMRVASERAARAVERAATGGSRSLTVIAMQSGARRA